MAKRTKLDELDRLVRLLREARREFYRENPSMMSNSAAEDWAIAAAFLRDRDKQNRRKAHART